MSLRAFQMFKFFSSIPDTAAADALFAEAYACIEQGLCYDEVNDYVRPAL